MLALQVLSRRRPERLGTAHANSRGLSAERVGDAVAQLGQVLVQRYFRGDEGAAQIRALAPLAEAADVPYKHAEIVLKQDLARWTQLLLEYVVKEGFLPAPELLRVTMWTQLSYANMAYGVDGGVQTLIGLNAEHVDEYALPLIAEPWIHGSGHDPTRLSRRKLAKLRKRWPDAPFPRSPQQSVRILLQSVSQTQTALARQGGATALHKGLPIGAGPWHYGSPRPEQWTIAPHVSAAGDLPGVLEEMSNQQFPGVLMAMVDPAGDQVGSLDDRVEYASPTGTTITGDAFLEALLGGDDVLAEDLVDIGHDTAPPGVRVQRTRGGLLTDSGPRRLLVWRDSHGEPIIFVQNLHAGAVGDRLLTETAERVITTNRDEGRADCLRRFYDAHGAPFTCQGTGYTSRRALYGLATLVNVAIVAAARTGGAA
jgi:hypothetical protein